MVAQGCAYTRSIHSGVTVGLGECSSRVQCVHTRSIHLYAVMIDQLLNVLFVRYWGFLYTAMMYSLVSESSHWTIIGEMQSSA